MKSDQPEYKIGQFVEVVKREGGHKFPINSVVKIIHFAFGWVVCEDEKKEWWYLNRFEITPSDKKAFYNPCF